MRSLAVIALALCVVLASNTVRPGGWTAVAAGGSTLTRPEDPVVLTGSDISALNGIAPHDLVAFRYDGAWTQIPVQVDERDAKTFTAVYNNMLLSPTTELFYTDPNTWTGGDSNPALDANDEVAFMSADAGGQPPSFSQPPNTVLGSGVQVAVNDPLASAQHGWVYLFRSDGSLDPAAGATYVTYTFNLNSGNYKATYTLGDTHPALAGNPENSTVATLNYTYHFGDRWQEDQIKISLGGASNVDILDRHKAMFGPGSCVRSEDTFDGYINTLPIEGAFVANKSGPVRAIRSYVGANSGPRTQRDQIFYAQRQEIRTYLRVHAIPSILDFFDYSPAATGMTYYNDLNTGGVVIDGVPETPAAGPIQWQMVTGAQGTLVAAAAISTNIPGFAYTSYYLDDSTPGSGAETQCTGDAFAYGSSGVYVNQQIPCTDPVLQNCTSHLDTTSVMYYEPPSQPVSVAQALAARANTPLSFVITPFQGPDGDADGVADIIDNCPSVSNPSQANTDHAIDNGPGIAMPDTTVPDAVDDSAGDACSPGPDTDHDGLPDAEDTAPLGPAGICAAFSGMTDNHPDPAGGDITNDDNGDGIPAPTDAADNGPSWDTDNDGVLDGVECQLGANPRSAASKPTAGECGGSTDADLDGLPASAEHCKWGTSDASPNTDGDTTKDCVEANDTNGDGVQNFPGDTINSAKAASGVIGKTMDFDLNGDGAVNFPGDTILSAKMVNHIGGICM